jgi:hypothetical protein
LRPVAAKNPQQGQQALEDVEQVQVDGQGGADVIGFAAVDHLFQVVQQVGAEHCDSQGADHRHHHGRGDKHVDDGRDHDDQGTGKKPFAHAAQVALDDGGQAGHHEHHPGRAGKSRHNQRCAVAEAQHHGDQAREHQAHEEGEAQQHGHARSRVLGLLNGKNETECTAQEHDQAQSACQ